MTTRPTWLRPLRGRPSGSAPAHPPKASRRAPLRLEALEDRAVPAGFAFGIDGPLARETHADNEGNIYTVGSFNGTPDFDPGPASSTLTSAGESDAYVAKYAAGGSFLWARRMGGPLLDSATDLALDADGGLLIAGLFKGSAAFGATTLSAAGNVDSYLTRLDAAGNFQWAVDVGANTSTSADVLADAFGGIYLTGAFTGASDFDPGAGTYHLTSLGTASDAFVTKLNVGADPGAAPTFAWAHRMGCPAGYSDRGNALESDGEGGVYVGGHFSGGGNSTADFGPSITLSTEPFPDGSSGSSVSANGGGNGFLTRLGSDGDFLWAQKLQSTGSNIQGLATDAAGNVYATGTVGNKVDFDPAPERIDLHPASISSFVWALDRHGNYRWGRVLSQGPGENMALDAIAVDGFGNVYVAGVLEGGDAEFDPGPGVVPVVEVGVDRLYLSKLDAAGNLVSLRHFGGPGYDDVQRMTLVANPGGAPPDVLMSGNFHGSATFDTGAGSVDLQTGSPETRGAFVVRMTQERSAILGRVVHQLAGAEEGLAPQDWTVYLDQNDNGQLDEMELSTTTGTYGQYEFYHLPAGTYSVRRMLQAGWSPASPTTDPLHTVILSDGQFAFNRDFRVITTGVPSTRTYSVTKAISLKDHSTTTSKVTVPIGFTVYDVNVRVDIVHPNVSDLLVTLVAPDGKRVLLTSYQGGPGDNYTNTTFSDEAATSIRVGSAPFAGNFRPIEPLSVLDGKNAAGVWTLEVVDNLWNALKGTLKSWSMTLIGSA